MKDLHVKDHLTDEQFAACLDGTPIQVELQSHLWECEQCSIEMQLFQASVSDFGGAAFDWSSAQPMPSLRPVVLAKHRWSAGFGLQWALAAMLIVGVGVPVLLHTQQRTQSKDASTAVATADDSDTQIAQDNAMLKSVSLAISSTEPSPFQEYGLSPGLQKERLSHSLPRAQ